MSAAPPLSVTPSQARAERARRREVALDELAIRHLADFVRRLWHVVEPRRPLVWGRHLDLICARVERSYRGDLPETDLVINIPPRCSKSSIVSVLGPAWWWLSRPETQFLALTKAEKNAARDARLMRRVVLSDDYQRLLRRSAVAAGEDPNDVWRLSEDQNRIDYYANTAGGHRISLTFDSNVTGAGADFLIPDDPHDASEVARLSPDQTARLMREAREKWDTVWLSRLNPGGRVQLVMQRLHQGDLAGVLLERGAAHLVLPWEYEPEHPYRDPEDWRTEPGEPLAPQWLDATIRERIRKAPASVRAGQYQQRPTSQEGGLFRRAWFERRYRGDPTTLEMEEWAMSVDCTFKDKADADYVVIGVWGRRGPNRYRLDQIRARMSYVETKAAARALRAKWSRVGVVLVEDKANGSALIDDLRLEIPGVVAFEPGARSKYERAAVGTAPIVEGGNLYLPDGAAWVSDYIEEHVNFPNGANDDQVDETSQMMLYWARPGQDWTAEWVGNAAEED